MNFSNKSSPNSLKQSESNLKQNQQILIDRINLVLQYSNQFTQQFLSARQNESLSTSNENSYKEGDSQYQSAFLSENANFDGINEEISMNIRQRAILNNDQIGMFTSEQMAGIQMPLVLFLPTIHEDEEGENEEDEKSHDKPSRNDTLQNEGNFIRIKGHPQGERTSLATQQNADVVVQDKKECLAPSTTITNEQQDSSENSTPLSKVSTDSSSNTSQTATSNASIAIAKNSDSNISSQILHKNEHPTVDGSSATTFPNETITTLKRREIEEEPIVTEQSQQRYLEIGLLEENARGAPGVVGQIDNRGKTSKNAVEQPPNAFLNQSNQLRSSIIKSVPNSSIQSPLIPSKNTPNITSTPLRTLEQQIKQKEKSAINPQVNIVTATTAATSISTNSRSSKRSSDDELAREWSTMSDFFTKRKEKEIAAAAAAITSNKKSINGIKGKQNEQNKPVATARADQLVNSLMKAIQFSKAAVPPNSETSKQFNKSEVIEMKKDQYQSQDWIVYRSQRKSQDHIEVSTPTSSNKSSFLRASEINGQDGDYGTEKKGLDQDSSKKYRGADNNKTEPSTRNRSEYFAQKESQQAKTDITFSENQDKNRLIHNPLLRHKKNQSTPILMKPTKPITTTTTTVAASATPKSVKSYEAGGNRQESSTKLIQTSAQKQQPIMCISICEDNSYLSSYRQKQQQQNILANLQSAINVDQQKQLLSLLAANSSSRENLKSSKSKRLLNQQESEQIQQNQPKNAVKQNIIRISLEETEPQLAKSIASENQSKDKSNIKNKNSIIHKGIPISPTFTPFIGSEKNNLKSLQNTPQESLQKKFSKVSHLF